MDDQKCQKQYRLESCRCFTDDLDAICRVDVDKKESEYFFKFQKLFTLPYILQHRTLLYYAELSRNYNIKIVQCWIINKERK